MDDQMPTELPDDAPRPRRCHLRKWPDFDGYGFNLYAERGRPGQFVGKIDPGSPAEAAGLRQGDRIVEVNGTNVGLENHQQVVQRIKAVDNEATFLVVDDLTDAYYRDRKLVISGSLPNVLRLETPPRNPSTFATTEDEPSASAVVHNGNGVCVTETTEPCCASVTDPPDTAYTARLCELRTWPDSTGYGFNLHAERGRPEQFIGKVDRGSPAEAAGLREGDRIVAVNGVDVLGMSHQDVVMRIREDSCRVALLVVDQAADDYFRQNAIVPMTSMSAVQRIVCPETNPNTSGGRRASDEDGGSPSSPSASPSIVASTESPLLSAVMTAEHRPRLCHIRAWRDGRGFGFNMQAERGRPGQFIGKVDPGSPAEAAGLRQGDRIVEVNGTNVEQESHKQVVERIKAIPNEAQLLVVDRATEMYLAEKGIAISGQLECIEKIVCPEDKPTADENGTGREDDVESVTGEMEKVAADIIRLAVENSENLPKEPEPENTNDGKPVMTSQQSEEIQQQNQPMSPSTPSSGSQVSISGLELAGSVEEARRRMAKKKNVKMSGMSLKEKYELLQKL